MLNSLIDLYRKTVSKLKNRKRNEKISENLKKEWEKLTGDILERQDPPKGETPIWFNLKTVIDPDTNHPLPFEILRTEVASVVTTGTHSTGHQLCWILGMIATHPKVEQKLIEELKENHLDGLNGQNTTLEDLGRLPYFECCDQGRFQNGSCCDKRIYALSSKKHVSSRISLAQRNGY